MYYLVIYYNENKKEFYYKLKDFWYARTHPIGYVNQYNHKVVLIVSIDKNLLPKPTIKLFLHNLLIKVIRFCKNIDYSINDRKF